ncbi:hypothetical protein NQZ68_033862 [Dissostichus eleginoides]|nr:hypothetical protein NQZ68_033862 [Dissostichus eleginoides]
MLWRHAVTKALPTSVQDRLEDVRRQGGHLQQFKLRKNQRIKCRTNKEEEEEEEVSEEEVSRMVDATHVVRRHIGPKNVHKTKFSSHKHHSIFQHNSSNSKHLCILLPKYSCKHRYTLPYSINKRDNGEESNDQEEEGMMAASYVEILDIWPEIAPLSNIHHNLAPHNTEENQC